MNEPRKHRFKNEDEMYQVLNLIFYAMVGVPLVVFLYLYLEIKDGKFVAESQGEDFEMVLLILIPIFSFINVLLGYIFYRKLIKNIQSSDQLRDKLQVFYKGSAIKYSFLEAATIFSLLGLFFTTDMIYVSLYLVILLVFSLNRPTPYRFRKDMKIKTYPPRSKNKMEKAQNHENKKSSL